MTVDEVFYIKNPIDRVIVVGTISEGNIQPGDKMSLVNGKGSIPVVVEKIEHPAVGALQIAEKGQQVGVMLSGLQKEQVSSGDRLTR